MHFGSAFCNSATPASVTCVFCTSSDVRFLSCANSFSPTSVTLVYATSFLDIEGVPDRDAYYLAGLLVCKAGEAEYESFWADRKSTRLNSSHLGISYAVFCL